MTAVCACATAAPVGVMSAAAEASAVACACPCAVTVSREAAWSATVVDATAWAVAVIATGVVPATRSGAGSLRTFFDPRAIRTAA